MNQPKRNVALIMMGIAILASTSGFAVGDNFGEKTQTTAEKSSMRGHVEVMAIDENGLIKQYRQSDNLIVNSGKNATADELWPTDLEISTNTENTEYDFIEIDTDGTAPADTQTGVLGSSTCARIQSGTTTADKNESTNDLIITLVSTFDGAASGCAATFQEAALHNVVTGGQALARNTFGSVPLAATDDLVVTWNVTID